MDFVEVVKQAQDLLKSEGRVTYRTLKRQFGLDDDALEDLTEELIYAKRVASDEDGRVLVWVGDGELSPQPALARAESQPQAPSTSTPQHLAERKTITALFADLKGSTALIEGLDPEDARAIIDPALQLIMDAVHRYDGYVAQSLGDGIFALFGAPNSA